MFLWHCYGDHDEYICNIHCVIDHNDDDNHGCDGDDKSEPGKHFVCGWLESCDDDINKDDDYSELQNVTDCADTSI